MFVLSAIFIASAIQPLFAIPYCTVPWREAFPSEDAPKSCSNVYECVGADNPRCVLSMRTYRNVCCQNTPPTSPNYVEAPPFESEGIVPNFVTNSPPPLLSGTSFSVAFDTVLVKDGERFVFNDTNRAKLTSNTFKVTYTYPRKNPTNSTFNPFEQFLLIILLPDAENRLKPVKRSVPAFVAELSLDQAHLVSGVATIEFTQSTPTPIVSAALTAPTAHPAQPFNRYVIMLFKKTDRQPTSPATIKEFGDTLPAPLKIPTASAGLWNVKGYLEKLAAARYIESVTPVAGLVYLVQSTAT
uniref:Uncharacterized protein n=1 Tax=Plectus sambesii TaxID=2011161 RepID=A0A914WDL7_9BILA